MVIRPLPTGDLTEGKRPGQLVVIHQPVNALTLNPKNPRLHGQRQIRQIAHSIRAFGFNVPILTDSNLGVIAGEGRLLAAKELRLAEVPTICLEHLNDAQRRAFMLADNRLTETSIWDDRLLGEQLRELSVLDLDFSLEATGFEVAEIDLRIEGLTAGSGAQDDSADTLPLHSDAPPVTQVGDLWLLGRHRVLCGDALDPLAYHAVMQHERATTVFTDPPYNVRIDGHVSGRGSIHHREFAMACGEMNEAEFTRFLTRACGLAASHSQDGAIHYICMDWRHIGEVLAAGEQVYSGLKNICVWVKHNAGMGSFYRSQHELVLVFKHGHGSHRNNIELGRFGRHRSNVWNYDGANLLGRGTHDEGNPLKFHPTVKPVAMIADAVLDCSARGEIVLDPFLGSGSTVIAAQRTDRRCCGIEIDPIYVDTLIRRWQSFTGEDASPHFSHE
jgi:16S rRNA G966 N2-methylase RsmD